MLFFFLKELTQASSAFLSYIRGDSTLHVKIKGVSSCISFPANTSIWNNMYNDINSQGKLEGSSK